MATDRPEPGDRLGGAPAPAETGPAWRRLAWFVGIWAASAAAVIVFGWVVRKLIGM